MYVNKKNEIWKAEFLRHLRNGTMFVYEPMRLLSANNGMVGGFEGQNYRLQMDGDEIKRRNDTLYNHNVTLNS